MSQPLIEEISKWFKENKFNSDEGGFSNQACNEFKLAYLGCGVSRWVFKERYSRTVIKIGKSEHNRAEYTTYYGFENFKFSSIFAKPLFISNDGVVMEQEYIPKRLPKTFDTYPYDLWAKLRDTLEGEFNFLKKFIKESYVVCDFHEDNIRYTHQGDLKIIDYSSLLSCIASPKKFDIPSCIKRLKRYTKKHDKHIDLYLNQSGQMVLEVGDNTIVAPPKIEVQNEAIH